MGEDTKIEWATATFNPWSGCTKVSPGCANCYAETMAKRFPHMGNWGPGAERKRTSEANWRKPLAWDRKASGQEATCSGCGLPRGMHGPVLAEAGDPQCDAGVRSEFVPRRPRVFCASLADWLDPEVPAEWLADLLALIAATPHLDWLLLTKRPRLWRERLEAAHSSRPFADSRRWLSGEAPANVWVGTSVEDQARADERIPLLLQIPARVRFLSCEPLLGPVVLPGSWWAQDAQPWVIVGGESGPGARPMHPDWARNLRDQCMGEHTDESVPFFLKQWGAWVGGTYEQEHPTDELPERINGRPVHDFGEGVMAVRVGKKLAGRLLDGRTWDEVPT